MTEPLQANPAANAGQGTPPPSGESGEQPKHVTEEQLNRAISARLGDFQKKFEAKFVEQIGGVSKSFEEMLSSKLEAFKPIPPEPKKGDKVEPPPLEETPAYKALLQKTSALEKKAADAELRANQERSKALDTDLRRQVSEHLQRSGLDASRAKIATGHLVDSAKSVGYSEDGSVVFRSSDGEVDLSNGLKAWLKTDEGKALTPARGASGSGDGPRGQGAQASGQHGSAGKDPRALLRESFNQLLGKE